MKPIVRLAVAVVGLAALSLGAAWWWGQSREPEWTTESPQALKELELGFDAMMKHYWAESKTHFDRAAELDPNFAMARLGQAFGTHDGAERNRRLAELRQLDTQSLNPRERFMIEFWGARLSGETERADEVLTRHLKRFPDDVFALEAQCEVAWDAELWDAAERCYQRLLELMPSWVDAQDRLGYISMTRGDLDEAEERFRTYRFIAPDQPAPHDALGELLTLRGRYQEAEAAFEAALAVKPDFCDAYRHRVRLFMYSGQIDRVEAEAEKLATFDACRYLEQWGYQCQVRVWLANMRGDYDAAWRAGSAPECAKMEMYKLHLHRAAVMTGRISEAIAIEEELRQVIEKMTSSALPKKLDYDRAALLHMQGVRELAQGQLATASEHLGAADELLTYWEREQGGFKQLNRVSLMRSLENEGRLAEARAIWADMRQLNPGFGMPPEIAARDPLAAWNGPTQ